MFYIPLSRVNKRWMVRWLHVALTLGLLLGGVQPMTAIASPASKRHFASQKSAVGNNDAIKQSSHGKELGRVLALEISGPDEVTPGEDVLLTVEAWNIGSQPLEDVQLRVIERPNAGMVGQEIITLPRLDVNQRITTTIKARVDIIPGQILEFQVESFGVALDMEAKAFFRTVVRQTQPEIWQPVAGTNVWRSSIGHLEVALPDTRDARIALIAVRGLYGRGERRDPTHLYEFEIEARDAQGRVIEQFEQPVVLRWRYKEALQDALPILPPHFVWWNEQERRWESIPTKVDEKHGIIEAEVRHFSTYGVDDHVIEAGTDGFSGLNSDLYSGSASYRFPMPLVQRPAGFGPGLALNYNSRRRDQQQNFGSNGSLLGWGWRLDGLASIEWVASDTYKLSLGGATYTVKKTTSYGWYAQEAPGLKITRASSAHNAAWQVYTPDGTRYDFTATNTVWRCNTTTNPETLEELAKTFVLTAVTGPADAGDVVNNNGFDYSMNIAYTTEKRTVDVYCNNQQHNNLVYTYQTRPTQITYNGLSGGYDARVDFIYASRGDYPKDCTGGSCSNITGDHIYYYTQKLDKIEVWVQVGGAWTKARTYDFTSSVQDGRLVLDSVQVIGRGDTASLPATTFEYTNESSCSNSANCRLRLIRNGQGAKVYLNYEFGAAVYENGAWAWNMYRLTWLNPQNGFGGERPRNIWYSSWDADAGGHKLTIVTYWGDGNNNDGDERRSQHDFCHPLNASYCPNNIPNDTGHYGREFQTVVKNPVDGKIAYRTWRKFQRPPLPTGVDQQYEHVRFVLSERTEYAYDAQGNSQTVFHQKLAYELDHQGNWQYGNVTHIRDYNGSYQLIRTTERKYYPGTNVHNRVAEEWVWKGDVGGVCKGYTRYFYDNASSVTSPPTKGLLTKVEEAKTQCSSSGGDFIIRQKRGYENTWDNLAWQEDGLGHHTTYTYDANFHTYLTQTANPLGHTVSQTYDYVLGLPLTVTDEENDLSTSFTYDALGRKLTMNRPGGHASVDEEWQYGDYGGSSSPQWVMHKVYDGVTTPANPGSGYLVSWTYLDGFGRTLQTQREAEAGNGLAIATSVAYNKHNQLERRSLPYQLSQSPGVGYVAVSDWTSTPHTRYDYDNYGRVITTTAPNGSVTTTSYDILTTATIDANGHKVEQEVDAFGRLVYVRNYTGTGTDQDPYQLYGTTTYEYDVKDRLDKVIGPDGAVVDPDYNLLGWKTTLIDDNMGKWTYDYDAVGNLARQTDARNQRICFYYDTLNRLKGKTYSTGAGACPDDPGYGGYAVGYYYDGAYPGSQGAPQPQGKVTGKRTAMLWNGSDWRVYHYADVRGRLMQEQTRIDGTWYTTSYDYDDMDRVQSMTYPDDEVVKYAYNAQGLVEQMYRSSPSPSYYYVGATDYNALDQVELRRLGSVNGIVTTDYIYRNTDFRLQWIKTGNSSPYESLQKLEYAYDAVGNIDWIKDYKAPGGTQTLDFSYDELNRLVAAMTSGGSSGSYNENYSYDKAGNLTSKTDIGSYAYGASASNCQAGTPASKPHAVTAVGSYSFSYDCNGNTTHRLAAGRAYTLTYDAENRLSEVVTAIQHNNEVTRTLTAYVYDGDGLRVKSRVQTTSTLTSTVSVTITLYVGDYYEKTGSVIKKYYYANGQRVAMRDGGTVYFLLTDHLGSTAVTADGSGNRHGELWYKPWGENRGTPYGNTPTSFRFTGQREDATISLYFYNARYYDPALGRFIQPDTIVPNPGDPQSLNRYAYTRNNPVRYTDPSGHRYISPRPDPEEVPNPGPEILLPPSRSPTGDPVQVYWSEVESWDPGTTAEFVSVVASPFAAPVVGIAGDTMIGEVALPGLQTLWWKFASWAGLACADGDCGNEVRSVWQLRPWERGRVIEGTLGRSPELAENFPTIDRFENGVATSIKSIDLNAASYQNPARLSSTVMRYLNTLARWNGQQRPWGNIQISPADVQEKVLELAVPPGASPSQWRTLVQLQQTASEMNVRLDIVIFH